MKTQKAMPVTDSVSGFERHRMLRLPSSGFHQFHEILRSGAAAGIGSIRTAVIVPSRASPRSSTPICHSSPDSRQLAPGNVSLEHRIQNAPRRSSENLGGELVPSRMPFPRERMDGCRISGIAPSLAGTKNVLCMPIRKTVVITSTELQTASVGRLGESTPTKCGRLSPSSASPIITTSATFQKTITDRLLNRSPAAPHTTRRAETAA